MTALHKLTPTSSFC